MSPQRQCSVSRPTPVTGLRFIKRSAIITGGLAGATADIRFVPDLTLVQYPSFSISSSSKPK
jgi:hypothetical protein